MVSQFTVVTRANVPLDRLFDVSLSIDAHIDSMARSRERAIAGTTRGQIGLGETVTWSARHFGIQFTLTSKVTALDRPRRFVDEQVRGPSRRFHHEHLFEVDAGTTVMTDILTVESPIFGRLAERLVQAPYLRRLITQRNAHLVSQAR